jgi:uncharacterized protein DUF5676
MRLDTRAFGMAAALVAAVLFTVCALAVAVAPQPTTALAGYLIHMDLSGMTRSMTFGRFVGGLVLWSLGTGLVFAGVAAIYNRLTDRVRAPQPVATGRPLTQGAQF